MHKNPTDAWALPQFLDCILTNSKWVPQLPLDQQPPGNLQGRHSMTLHPASMQKLATYLAGFRLAFQSSPRDVLPPINVMGTHQGVKVQHLVMTRKRVFRLNMSLLAGER